MPFIGPDPGDSSRWHRISSVDLRQQPETKPRTTEFEVLTEFGYTTSEPDGVDASGPFWRPATVEYLVPRGMTTDLASVPGFLWGIVASYGRQTLPAILHDGLCYAAALPDQPAEYRRSARRDADRVFLDALEHAGTGTVRRWLMWTGVRLGGHPAVFVPFGAGLALVAGAALPTAARRPLGLGAAAAAVVLARSVVAAGRESRRTPAPAPGTAADRASEYTPARLEPRALGSLAAASAIGLLAAPVLLPVTLITVATGAIIRIGEKPILRTGRHPGTEDAPAGVHGGVTARIAWAPLPTAADSSVIANPAPSDF